ncbi:MAG: hypothetical protein KAW51_06640 [Candidatus Lokiarchaeota archaeon]|nr:hypothetical protein [Candidatus Lokiarchaeota archaeon]
MPRSITELLKHENSRLIENIILKFLRNNKGIALTFNEIEFNLIKEKQSGVNLGGKFFINNILRDLIKQKKIKSIISNGIEYFYLEID